MRFQVLTATSTKMTVSWVVAPCVVWWKLTDVSEELTAFIIRAIPDDGGSKHL
jgi:hypothetical protein